MGTSLQPPRVLAAIATEPAAAPACPGLGDAGSIAHWSRLFLLALLFLLARFVAPAAEWQWSVPMGKGRAFLWIPPQCQHLRGVVVAQNNMIELGILEHPAFRQTLADEGLGEVFIAPPFDFVFQFDQDAGERFNDVLGRLAEVSGYEELQGAPVVPLGHSACASFPWNFAAWHPGRTLAVLSIKGDAPLTKLTGSGRPNPAWGDRSLDGVPGLMVMAEFEWGDAEHGADRLSPALEYRRQHPQAPIAMLAEPGQGHFNYSDELVNYVALFVRKAAQARLPETAWRQASLPAVEPGILPGGTGVAESKRVEVSRQKPGGKMPPSTAGKDACRYELKSVDPAKGWLVERWHLNQPRKFQPAPYAKYQGDPAQAFWCFDQEMAHATHNYQANQVGKRPQLLSVSDGVMPIEDSSGEPVTPRFIPDSDGVTFHLQTAFMDFVPTNGNAARWAYAPAGTKLGHARDGGPIRLQKIVGPAVQTGPNTFQFAMNRGNATEDRRNFDIWVWASHPGGAQYKSIVQQAMIRVPQNAEGREQRITFPEIGAVRAGTKALKLTASSDAGTKVYYYVREGPAEVTGDTLKFTKIPPRARFPVKVTVVAWQHGLSGKVKTATPVTREFYLTK